MSKTTRRCFVLVDWWGQIRSEFYHGASASPGYCSEKALRKVEFLVEKRLVLEVEQPGRWEISFRLYAGWMRGGTPTAVLKDFNGLFGGYAKRRRMGSALKTVIFLPSSIGLRRGDSLLSDEAGRRKERSSRVHFPYTSRSECNCPLCNHLNHIAQDGFKCERTIEKQVDTSIVADAITLSLSKERPKIIMISNDDDVLPGLIAGESLGGDITLMNTVQKRHTHASQLSDLILGPEEICA
jgi:hypothetical protein